jgi:hypothetical protein
MCGCIKPDGEGVVKPFSGPFWDSLTDYHYWISSSSAAGVGPDREYSYDIGN